MSKHITLYCRIEQLKLGYQANADESMQIAAEWFPIEEEATQPRRSRRGKTSK